MSNPAHVAPKRLYFGIFLALLGLTFVTTWVAFRDLGAMNTPVALAIAGLKASLVLWFFMHLNHAGRLVKLYLLAGLLLVVIMLSLGLSDVFSRQWIPLNIPAH